MFSFSFDVIAACDFNGSIGKNGTIPWYIPEDFKHFKEITTQVSDPKLRNAVIMGRKTWESLPNGKLRGRLNLVVSTTLNIDTNDDDVMVFRTFEEAVFYIKTIRRYLSNAFVIGGGRLYTDALKHPCVSKVYLTVVHDRIPNCDARFPLKLLSDVFVEVDEDYSGVLKSRDPSAPPFSFHVWEKGWFEK